MARHPRTKTRVFELLPLEVKKHTLLVVNMRLPRDRVVSSYFYLNKCEG